VLQSLNAVPNGKRQPRGERMSKGSQLTHDRHAERNKSGEYQGVRRGTLERELMCTVVGGGKKAAEGAKANENWGGGARVAARGRLWGVSYQRAQKQQM